MGLTSWIEDELRYVESIVLLTRSYLVFQVLRSLHGSNINCLQLKLDIENMMAKFRSTKDQLNFAIFYVQYENIQKVIDICS